MPGMLEMKGAKQHDLGGLRSQYRERARAISCLGMTELR